MKVKGEQRMRVQCLREGVRWGREFRSMSPAERPLSLARCLW